MADLNALIAQGVQFAPPINPMDQFAKMQAMQQGQQANQLNQMKMQEYQRGMEEQNNLRQLDYNSPTYLQDVMKINPETGFKFSKLQQEGAAAKLKQQTDTSTLVDSKLKQSRQFLENVTTPEQYLAWHESNRADPILGPLLDSRGITADSARAQIEKALGQPGGFEQLLNQSKLGVEKFAEMNKPTWVQAGGTVQPMNGLTGQPSTGIAPITRTATPGELMTAATAKAGQGITIRGQDLTAAREKERLDFQKQGGASGLTPEQNDALYGPNGSVSKGLIDPYKITGRTAKILANAAIANPDLDLNKLAQESVLMRNVQTVNKSKQIEMMPEILQNVVTAGKKVNFSDAQFVGAVEKFAKGQMNDPDFVNYMTQRNDALLTLAGVMRGNGATDMSTRMETEAYHPTLSPTALDGWMNAQMTALKPRLRNAHEVLRTPSAATPAPATPAPAAPTPVKPTPRATASNW